MFTSRTLFENFKTVSRNLEISSPTLTAAQFIAGFVVKLGFVRLDPLQLKILSEMPHMWREKL